MAGDAAHGLAQEPESRRHPMPGRSAGWMRQGDNIERAPVAVQRERAADHFVELLEGKKLRDREFSYRNDKLRLQEIDFIVHPGRAISDFIRRRNAVAARSRFAGKAAADGGEINLRAHFVFPKTTKLLEPAKKSATRR